MREIDEANIKLFIGALENLRDSQFLGWMAMQLHEQCNPITDYCARRLNLIAIRVDADECVSASGDVGMD